MGIHSTLIGFKSNEEVVIPEAIRLMNFEEFIANMKNDKSETQLIKEIIIHLLNHLELKNSQFFESCLALLTDTFSPYKSEIINKYYLEIAYEFYQNNQK